jgi:hypothetical protein
LREERTTPASDFHTCVPSGSTECNALDCQIGNVVSFISLPGNDAKELAAIALKAEVFGLYTFCSEGVVAENDELLGSLEMYCSVPRSPSAAEYQGLNEQHVWLRLRSSLTMMQAIKAIMRCVVTGQCAGECSNGQFL